MGPVPGHEHPEALALAQLFSTCVECFGHIHPGREWDHDQLVVVAKLGIQQGRLLAWGDMVGILDTSESRDSRLEDPEMLKTIESALQSIIDRPAHYKREDQFELYGLKSPKRFSSASQPALDMARIESFRERLEVLQKQRWEVKRGMSITISHWIIHDVHKFQKYLDLVKEKIDFLVGLMGVDDKVKRAMIHDIRALGWHPVFTKPKASSDMAKLRLIKETCEQDYPEYVEATQGALDYLDKEWADNYLELLQQHNKHESAGSEIPGAAAYMLAQSQQLTSAYSKPKEKSSPRVSLFGKLRPKSWRKSSQDISAKGRSISHTPTTTGSHSPPLTPERERAKSIAVPVMSMERESEPMVDGKEENMLAKIETAKSAGTATTMEPVTSMISRHDQWQDVYLGKRAKA